MNEELRPICDIRQLGMNYRLVLKAQAFIPIRLR